MGCCNGKNREEEEKKNNSSLIDKSVKDPGEILMDLGKQSFFFFMNSNKDNTKQNGVHFDE